MERRGKGAVGACTNADMTLDAFLVFYMAKKLYFLGNVKTHRANVAAFKLAFCAFLDLSYLVRCQLFCPAEPEPESADASTKSPFSKKKNQKKAADDSSHAYQQNRPRNS
jgi:hypothetical protein